MAWSRETISFSTAMFLTALKSSFRRWKECCLFIKTDHLSLSVCIVVIYSMLLLCRVTLSLRSKVLFTSKLYFIHSWHVSVPRLSILKHWSTYLLSWGASSQHWSVGFIFRKRKTNSGEGDDLYLVCQWEIRLTLLFFVYGGNSASSLRMIRSVRASVLVDRRIEWWRQGECVRARFLSLIYIWAVEKKEKKKLRIMRGKAK